MSDPKLVAAIEYETAFLDSEDKAPQFKLVGEFGVQVGPTGDEFMIGKLMDYLTDFCGYTDLKKVAIRS